MRGRHRRQQRGQALVELALIFPLFVMVLIGIITLGIGVFYQQQVANAAREAARYASIHSGTALCPTVSWLDPDDEDPVGSGNLGAHAAYIPESYTRFCDRPEDSWPKMTAAGQRLVFGLESSAVNIAACWSGYRIKDGFGNPTGSFDAPPPGAYDFGTIDSGWAACTIDGADPSQDPAAIGCNAFLAATTIDQASSLSEGAGRVLANVVTAYACYEWAPPMAGFLLIPDTVTLRAVVSEPIERQQ